MPPSNAHVASGLVVPTEAHAAVIFRRWTGHDAVHVRRFPTGLAHYVFDVAGEAVSGVVRIARRGRQGAFRSAIYWSAACVPRGAVAEAHRRSDPFDGFDYLLLERLPGTDLAHVYQDLSPHQKREIVARVVLAQARVQELRAGSGTAMWRPLRARSPPELARGRVRQRGTQPRAISATRVVDVAIADRSSGGWITLNRTCGACATTFLDDTTTKTSSVTAVG